MGMKLFSECEALREKNESFVLVTLVSSRGSAPQDPGAKIVVTKDGLKAGTIGGGKVEAAAIKRAQEILQGSAEKEPELLNWNLQKDIGMSCGGEVSVLFEHHHFSNWPIVIFGAGHVSQALTRLLSKLNCSVTCIDHRSEWVEKLEGVKTIVSPEPKKAVSQFPKDAYFLSMTMGHAHDVPILHEIFLTHPDCPYVGVIGSEVKGIKIKRELKELGASEEFLKKLRVPVGLPIGSNDPWEIAISIAAELIQVRDAGK